MKRARMLAAAAAALTLLTGAAVIAADAPKPQLAHKARMATKAPLLHATVAGKRLVAVGDYGMVLLSDDGGQNWRQAASVASRTTLTAVSFADDKRGWAVGHGGIVMHTQDGGENWTPQFSAGGDTALFSVWFENADRGFIVGTFGYAAVTRDGGKTWNEIVIAEGEDRDRHLNAVFPGPNGSVFIAAEAGSIFRSDDGGQRWTKLKVPYNGSFWGGLTLKDGAIVVVGMRGHIFRSEDRGNTWSEIASGTDQSLTGITQLADGRVVVVGLGGAVVTSNDGKTFRTAIRPDRQTLAAALGGAAGKLILLGQTGVASQPLAPDNVATAKP